MAEYIEREAVCYQLAKQATIDGQPRAIKRAAKIVADFPAADVRPVVRGHWEYISFMIVKCSNCQETFQELAGDNFCPNCGADMREES